MTERAIIWGVLIVWAMALAWFIYNLGEGIIQWMT